MPNSFILTFSVHHCFFNLFLFCLCSNLLEYSKIFSLDVLFSFLLSFITHCFVLIVALHFHVSMSKLLKLTKYLTELNKLK